MSARKAGRSSPSVIRIPKRARFVQMATEIVEDRSLSWDAKGMMGYLLSRPDNWEVRVADLVNQSTEGRDATYAIVTELIGAGYLERTEVRVGGRFHHYEYTVIERPERGIETPPPYTGNQEAADPANDPPLPGNPDTAKPYTENPDHRKEEFLLMNEETKEEANARVAALFDEFWELYPKRKGRKDGKPQAREKWMKLTDAERALAMIGVRHFAAYTESEGTWPKDAHRWLTEKRWEEWQVPYAAGSNPSPAGGRKGSAPFVAPTLEDYAEGVAPEDVWMGTGTEGGS